MERWPTKPRANDKCEASTGWEEVLGQPVLKKCGAPATETVLISETMRIPVYVCADHAYLGYRNPKRRGEHAMISSDVKSEIDWAVQRLREEFMDYVRQEVDEKVAMKREIDDLKRELAVVAAQARSADVRTKPIGY